MDPNTIRILSIDGGGMRGYISANFMELFVQQWGIAPEEIWKYFDVIAGTSIGGIAAVGYANGITPTALKTFFIEDGPWIFSTSTSQPGVRVTTLQKMAIMILGGTFYSNVNLINKLDEEFGDITLDNLKTNILLPSYRSDTKSLVYFSNVNFSGGITGRAKDAALATASAPLFFPPASFGGHTYLDGGIFQNNPSTIALALGKTLKPNANRSCVLSVGTGLGDRGFHNVTPPSPEDPDPPPFFSNMGLIMEILGTAVTGAQEANAKELEILSSYTLEELYYYRFQYVLDPEQDTELDNSSPEFIEYMQESSTTQFNNEILDIGTFIGHLTA